MIDHSNIVVVFDDSKKDPSYTNLSNSYVMRLNDNALRHYHSIGTIESNGDVLKIYNLSKIMEIMEQSGLLHTCEVDKRSGAL